MGKKAKLKKNRHQSETPKQNDPNDFVKQLERQGYQMQRVNPCPEIPEKKTEPQV